MVAVAGPDDGINLPVTKAGPVVCIHRSVADRVSPWQIPAGISFSKSFAASLGELPEVGVKEATFKLVAPHESINGLMTNLKNSPAAELARYLPGTPVPSQKRADKIWLGRISYSPKPNEQNWGQQKFGG